MLKKYFFLSLAMSFCFTQASQAQSTTSGASWQQASATAAISNNASVAATGNVAGNTNGSVTSTRSLNTVQTPYGLPNLNQAATGLLAPQDPFMINAVPSGSFKYGFNGIPIPTGYQLMHGLILPGTSTASNDLNTVDNGGLEALNDAAAAAAQYTMGLIEGDVASVLSTSSQATSAPTDNVPGGTMPDSSSLSSQGSVSSYINGSP